MKETIKLIGSRILISLQEKETEIDGLALVQSEEVDQTLGIVEAISSEIKEVTVGDKVMINRYSGTGIKIKGKAHRIVLENDILLIIKSDNNE